MPFFEDVDGTGIIEHHIKEVLRLEDDQQSIILKRYKDIRLELVDRLSKAPRGSFTAQHLRGVLGQVQGAIVAMTKHLNGAMVEGSQIAALKGVNHLIKEINLFDKKFAGAITPIDLNAALIAQDTAKLLVTRYKTNLDAYGSNLLAQVSNGLFSAAIGETSYEEIIGRVSHFFNAEEWKLRRIVRTELHGIYNRGKLAGLQELDDEGEEFLRTLMHPMDARTGDDSKFAATQGLVAKMGEPFHYVWDGKHRVFFTPPDRPNDRAVMVPYRKEWGRIQGKAFIPGNFPEA